MLSPCQEALTKGKQLGMFSVGSDGKSSSSNAHSLEAGALHQNEKTVPTWKGLDNIFFNYKELFIINIKREGCLEVHVTW